MSRRAARLWKFGRVGMEVWGCVLSKQRHRNTVKTIENVALKHEKASGSFSRGMWKFGGSLAPEGSTKSERISRILQTAAAQILGKSTTQRGLKLCTHFLLVCTNSVAKVCFNFG